MALKTMSKKAQIITAALALLLVGLAVFALFGGSTKEETLAQGNLIVNGDFTAVTDGQPDGWTQGMWVTSPGAS